MPANDGHPDDPVRMAQVDLSIDVGGKVFGDLGSVMVLST